MRNLNLSDTIAAISTPIGESGIGIVRISGKEALKIADKIFSCRLGKPASSFKTYTTHYGWVNDDANIIDEVILTVMRAPGSYTKEDIVEINCHGGAIALRRVLELVLASGARLAEPGEFTKRAFLNGRIDLAQAEAVLDIIRAKTDSALKLGVEQLKGGVSKEINKARAELIEILSLLEANIDFPDEAIDAPNPKDSGRKLRQVNEQILGLLRDSSRARIFREGIHTVICGKPNAGKSSLLNAILRKERSIVTAVPGTTRDTIEEVIDIRGIPVRIVDTAGILEPRDLVERKAMQRSKKHIDLADLVIIVFDAGRKLSAQDRILIKKLKKKTAIAVINKMDLRHKIEKGDISKEFSRVIEVSAKKSKNINLLEDAISDSVFTGGAKSSDSVMVCNLRHIEKLRSAQKFIAQALDSLDNGLSAEFIAQDIKEALLYLDDLLGKRFSEDLLDRLFSEFCIGK